MILSSEEELSAGRRTKGPEPRGEYRHTQVEAAMPPNPPEGMEGRSWAAQHSSPHPHWMKLLFAVTTQVSDCQPQGDVTSRVISAEGRAWARGGDVRSPAFLRWPLGKHGGRAWSSFLQALFTDLPGPAWLLSLLSAQIAPLISTLLIAEGQTSLLTFTSSPPSSE